jgi:DNA-binding PucR family transcriptional regulator
VPDPSRPGRRPRLVAALRGTGAVVGQPVAPEGLPASLRVAEIAARLRHSGVGTQDPFFVDDHLDDIIVHRDARLLEALRDRCLSPLSGVAPATRQRLCDTLASWLRNLGDRRAVAADLFIHPQTVRYRMAQLHDLFGPALGDPATRARLTLALVWGHEVGPGRGHQHGVRPGRQPESSARS